MWDPGVNHLIAKGKEALSKTSHICTPPPLRRQFLRILNNNLLPQYLLPFFSYFKTAVSATIKNYQVAPVAVPTKNDLQHQSQRLSHVTS